MPAMQKITPFLWFDQEAEEAVKFYLTIFKGGKIREVVRYPEIAPHSSPESWPAPGSVMTIRFELFGQEFVALNGGPVFKFNESISFTVNCRTQREVDHYWKKLTAGGGRPSQCGWLKDKYGLSWQIVPTVLVDLVTDKDPQLRSRVMEAMLQMSKLDIKRLQRAARKAPANQPNKRRR